MTDLVPYLWGAGGIQLAIAAANLVLPRKLRYAENLRRVEPIIRQVFIVHSVYIVYVLVAFAVICFAFAPELAGATRLGTLPERVAGALLGAAIDCAVDLLRPHATPPEPCGALGILRGDSLPDRCLRRRCRGGAA